MSEGFCAGVVAPASPSMSGVAGLESVLLGFGAVKAAERLRDKAVELDNASADVLEETGQDLGLDVAQLVVPADHVPLVEAGLLPALVTVRDPRERFRWVVVWRHGERLEIADPVLGRSRKKAESLRDELFPHTTVVPAAAWREWAGSDDFLAPLRVRLRHLDLTPATALKILEGALEDPGWSTLAATDAAVRFVAAGNLMSEPTLTGLIDVASKRGERFSAIPFRHWVVVPTSRREDTEDLYFRGTVVLRVRSTP